MMFRHLRLSSGRLSHKARVTLLAVPLLLSLSWATSADPCWWTGPKRDVTRISLQTGKGIGLYFESPKANECVRMERETWPRITPGQADRDFIWVRLNPDDHQDFFVHWGVHSVPQIVVLDNRMEVRLRIRGFIKPPSLLRRLEEVPRLDPVMITTRDGLTFPVTESHRAAAELARRDLGGHFRTEAFNGYQTIGALNSSWFVPIQQAASRIDLAGGPDGSPCLVIDSGNQPRAEIRIDLSPGLDQTEQIEGRMRVTLAIRPIDLDANAQDIGFIRVVERNAPIDSETAHRSMLTLAGEYEIWTERSLISAPFNFRTHKAYLTLQVNGPAMHYYVDDLRIDLLPADPDGRLLLPADEPDTSM